LKLLNKTNTLLTEYHSSFTNKFTDLLQNSSFEDLPNKFIEKSEEAFQIGKVCPSGFSNLALAFCIFK